MATIDKANIKNLYRLSPLQGGMLFHALYDEGQRSYFEQGVYSIAGTVDVAAFEAAWNGVVERHDALRTLFVVKGVPEPLQLVLKNRPLDFRFQDLDGMGEKEQAAKVAEYAAQDKERGFDLTSDPLLRVALFRNGSTNYTMVLSFHHIIMDGWCQGIIASEFLAIYTALRAGRPALLPPAPQYREYILWLERQEKEQALAYWKDYLSGFDTPTHFPQRERTGSGEVPGGQQNVHIALTAAETTALKGFAAQKGVTLSTVVQALWGVLLARLNGGNDALFLSTVSGRPDNLEKAGSIVGLFINALPVRVRFQEDESFAQLLEGLRSSAGKSQPYQFAPLAEIQGNTSLKRDIANTLLVFENYPFTSSGEEAPFTFAQQSIDERTNYDVTVQVHPGEELEFGIAFDPQVIDPELMADAAEWVADAARRLAENPGATLAEFTAHGSRFRQEIEKKRSVEHPPIQVSVAATFTVDLALPTLAWWLRQGGYAPEVKVAPYNQVFQELLDPTSLFAGTDGFALLAVRFQDWVRDLAGESDQEIVRHLERSFAGYLQAIDGFSGNASLVHLLLPTNFSPFSAAVADKLRELEGRIVLAAEERANLFLHDARSLHTAYGIADPFDPVADRAGHVPYTPEMNAAIGTAMARKVLGRNQHPFKVIAVDCDNTLWQGICGEDGPAGVRVHGGYRALQQFLIERYREGFLIALCSKNNENDVWEVFEKNPDMLLQREHVVAHRINWLPKSGNLHGLAAELNVGVNSFIFIDDSGMECAEVRENAPDVLTLRLPEAHKAIPRFLQHIWSLDKWQVTDEDRKRSSMYAAEQQRQQNQEKATSLEEFLAGLELKIVMAPIAEHQVPRVSQLTQRTNQFNISTIRRDESEIRALLADRDYYCRSITVEDRFGEYGLVGVIVCRRNPAEQTLFVDSLLLSCRVLGRGVEQAILSGMRRYATANGLNEVEALFIPTKKNAPALNFLETWPGSRTVEENGNIRFRRTVEGLPDGIPFGRFEDRTEPLPEEEPPAKGSASVSALPGGTAVPTEAAGEREKEIVSGRKERGEQERVMGAEEWEGEHNGESSAEWEIALGETEHLLHAFYYLPLAYASGTALLSLPLSSGGTPSQEFQRPPYVPPQTPDERALVEMYSQILEHDPADPVGMRDNFFERGGHSLTAVVLLSRIHRTFSTEIGLREIFEYPTPQQLLRQIQAGEAQSLPPIPPLPQRDYYELSHAQRRMWALDDIQSEGAAYVMGGATIVEGPLDADALEEAFRAVIRRHESLRTGIVLVEDQPMAKVFDDVPFAIARVDLSATSPSAPLSPQEQERRAQALVEEQAVRRFDLSAPPLLRVLLIRLAEERHVLLMLLHHVVADGWSYSILMRELTAYYGAYRSAAAEPEMPGSAPDISTLFPPLPIHYKEYAAWQRSELEGEQAQQDERFWLEHLAGPLPTLELPADRPRPAQPNYAGGTVRITIGKGEAEAVRALCTQEGTTLFMFLLASVRTLLWRYAGARETVIGVPVAGRDHPDLLDQIGFYVNTLALRGEVVPEESFAAMLRRVREEVLEAFDHRTVPFDLIVGKLEGITRDTSRSPVFDVMMVLQNNRDFNEETEGVEGIRFRPFGEEAGAGKFDLTFNFNEVAEGIECRLEYRTELFNRETIEEIGRELQRLAGDAARLPGAPLAEIAVQYGALQSASREIAEAEIPQGTIVDRFRQTARNFPEQIAAVHGAACSTYSELDKRSNDVARRLAAMGIGKGELVAVLLERGIPLLEVMLGTMKRGALYLPIDPAYPEQRIQAILEDSGATLVIGNSREALSRLGTGAMIADLSEIVRSAGGVQEGEQRAEDSPTEESVVAHDPAYVIYTSGSTGKPKGVRVNHRGFLNMIAAQIAAFGITAADTVLQFASPAFDASLSEIFMALLTGATLRIPERQDVEDIDAFLHLLQEGNVTAATIPPVYLRAIGQRPMPTLRTLITAGEEAPRTDVLHYAQSMAVFNAYGPTECSVCATIHRVQPATAYPERIPIGEPISGVGAFVADEHLLPLPDGVAGELILFGAGLADGYLNDPATTDQRFVAPERLGATRCYRTGDRARKLRGGGFEFLGRIDNQIKIRGHRVEPEETRQALLRVDGVQDAAVLVAEDPAFGKSLVAFVCGDSSLNATAVQAAAARALPSFLHPQRLHVLDTLPMTVNGKVDRKKLEELHRREGGATTSGGGEEAKQGPRNDVERVLAEVFADVLRLQSVGIHDNFFALGGDSMKAIQVRAALARRGYDTRSRHIFEGETVAGIARLIVASGTAEETGRDAREVAEGAMPLTPIQNWMAERLPPDAWTEFGLALVADAGEPVDTAALKGALLDLVNGHDALRIRAAVASEPTEHGGEVEGVKTLTLAIGPRFAEVELREFDLRGSATDEADSAAPDSPNSLSDEISSVLQTLSSGFVFDGSAPLFKAGRLRTPEREMVVLGFHHLTVDALSLELLLEELNSRYEARREGYEIHEDAGRNNSASFAAWGRSLREYANAIPTARRERWRMLARQAAKGEQIFDPAGKTYGTRSFLFTVDPVTTGTLLSARRSWMEPQHLLLAALRRTVEKLTGQKDLPIMVEGHGRGADTPLDISGTVGWFTAAYPIPLTGAHRSVQEELREIRALLNPLKGSEAEYGVLRYCADDAALRRALHCAPQVSFNYLGEYGGGTAPRQRTFEHTTFESAGENRSLSDFELHIILEEGALKVRATCGPVVPELFARQFAQEYVAQIEAIAGELDRREEITMRLICLPYVGGNAHSFGPLGVELPDRVEMIPLELPGHGERIAETPLEQIEEIVADIVTQISGLQAPFERPYTLFGHSMGALLAYEVAHHIRGLELPQPEMLICAGAAAPQAFTNGRQEAENLDNGMIAAFYSDGSDGVDRVNGTSNAGRTEGSAEREKLMVAAAQADLKAVQNYRYAHRRALALPIAVLYGSDDDIPAAAMDGWRQETEGEVFFREIAGGHDFPTSNPAATATAIVHPVQAPGKVGASYHYTTAQAAEEL